MTDAWEWDFDAASVGQGKAPAVVGSAVVSKSWLPLMFFSRTEIDWCRTGCLEPVADITVLIASFAIIAILSFFRGRCHHRSGMHVRPERLALVVSLV